MLVDGKIGTTRALYLAAARANNATATRQTDRSSRIKIAASPGT